MTIRFLIILTTALLGAIVHAQDLACYHFDEKGSTRPLVIDQSHLKIHLAFDTLEQRVIGKITIDFTLKRFSVDTIALDAPNMSIQKMVLNGKKIRYQQRDNQVVFAASGLKATEKHQLEIDYEAQPEKGLYFVGWEKNPNVRRQIWTQGQGIDNRHWIPHVDAQNDKLTSELFITFDKKYEVISNGDLISKKEAANNQITWHYHLTKPHASYLIMLAIGEFDKKSYTSKSGVPITNYLYPNRLKDYDYTYRYTKEIFDWLEAELQVPYPWGSYKQAPVKDFLYGGMENTGATLFNDIYHSDEIELRGLGYFRVNVHELAHQWFGNYITSYAGRDHWLHEGFATYYEFLAEAHLLGEDIATLERLTALEAVLKSPPKKPVAHSESGNLGHYQKGGLVLHLLRETLGHDNYRKAITHYLKQFAEKNVVTQDLENAIHQATGFVLDTFFYQWVHHPAVPELTYSYQWIEKDNSSFIQLITKQQSDATFAFDIPTQFCYSLGKKEILVPIHLKNEVDTFLIPIKSKKFIQWAALDPHRLLPATIKSNASADELIQILTESNHLGTQWQSVQELKTTAELPSAEMLTVLEKAKLHPEIKAMAIGALVRNDTLPKRMVPYLQKNMTIPLAEALLDARWTADSTNFTILESMLDLPSMSVKEGALWSLFSAHPIGMSEYLIQTAPFANREYGVFPITYAFLQMLNGNRAYGPVLFDYLQPQHDVSQRKQAMDIFGLIKAPNPEILAAVYDASQHFNSRMRGPAKQFFQNAYEDPNRKAGVITFISSISADESEITERFKKLGIEYPAHESQ